MYKIRCCVNRNESEYVCEEGIQKLKNNKCIFGEIITDLVVKK